MSTFSCPRARTRSVSSEGLTRCGVRSGSPYPAWICRGRPRSRASSPRSRCHGGGGRDPGGGAVPVSTATGPPRPRPRRSWGARGPARIRSGRRSRSSADGARRLLIQGAGEGVGVGGGVHAVTPPPRRRSPAVRPRGPARASRPMAAGPRISPCGRSPPAGSPARPTAGAAGGPPRRPAPPPGQIVVGDTSGGSSRIGAHQRRMAKHRGVEVARSLGCRVESLGDEPLEGPTVQLTGDHPMAVMVDQRHSTDGRRGSGPDLSGSRSGIA